MELKVIDKEFSVCKVSDFSEIDTGQPYIFTGSTDEERSLVCPTELVPGNTIERNDGWKAFRIEGVLDFSLMLGWPLDEVLQKTLDAMRDCEARVASEMENI